MQIESLDRYDNRIIELLQQNGRASFSEIGEKVGLSRTAVKNRMEALEKNGYIRGYTAIVDTWQAAENVTFFLDIETEPAKFSEVAERLVKEKALRKIYVLTGECRIHAIGNVSNQLSLRSYFKGLYKSLSGVNRMVCHAVLDVIKDDDAGIVFGGTGGDKDNDVH